MAEVPEQQSQYIKLPNGEWGQFDANADDAYIHSRIKQDFPNAFDAQGTALATNPYTPAPTATTPTAAPAPKQTLTEKVLGYGKTAAGIALPAIGGALGGLAGAAVPLPGTALLGAMGGSTAGELLAQKLGVSDESNTQLALAAAGPLGGKLLGAAWAARPLLKSTVVKQVGKLLPAEASEKLFKAIPKVGLAGADAQPVAQAILDKAGSLVKAEPSLEEAFTQLLSPKGLTFAEAENLKNDLATFATKYATNGVQQNASLAREYRILRDVIVTQIDKMNPGYAKALHNFGIEENVARLKYIVDTNKSPAKEIEKILTLPKGDLSRTERGVRRTFAGNNNDQLQEIHSLSKQLFGDLSINDFVKARIASSLAAGVVAGSSGGQGQGFNTPRAMAATIGMMLAYPVGRRMLTELASKGLQNNPQALNLSTQVFRAMMARTPSSQDQAGPRSFPLADQQSQPQ